MARFNFGDDKFDKKIIITITTVCALIIIASIIYVCVAWADLNNTKKKAAEQGNNQAEQTMQQLSAYNQDIAVSNTCTAQVVMEQSSKTVMYSQNANVRMEMASTTKLVTALCVLENNQLDKIVTIPKQAVGIEGSSIYLREGQKFSVRDLLYGLMLRSGNDSAVALAIDTSGSVEKFVQLMNQKAKKLGCNNTNFVNPHGLSHPNHYTTAHELGILACQAMSNKDFATIVAAKSFKVEQNDTHDAMLFVNKNKMLSNFDGANGIKTGYTTKSGRCLVSSAKQNKMQLVCVVLNDYDMWNDSKGLMQRVFDNYDAIKLSDKENCVWKLPSIEGQEICIGLKNDISFPLKKNTKINLTFELNIDKNLSLPIQKGQKIGNICIYNDNRLLFDQEVITMNEIKSMGDLRTLNNFVGDLRLENYNGKIKQIFSCERSCIA